jgi:hypothetical protein
MYNRITLMERPLEAHHDIAATSAVLEVDGQTVKKSIPAGANQIHFNVNLKPGRTRLKSTLTGDSDVSRGADYASLLRLEKP